MRNKNMLGWSLAGTSLVSASLYGLFTYLSNDSYNSYSSTTITSDAISYREEFQTYDILSYVSLGTSLLSAGVSVY
ncbi:MAG: hypothetical protein PF693_05725 [Spirochaetia bacterium]|jgi:hypothetical protein|nr:hypothetical protein [Spirochaetia bacterium]